MECALDFSELGKATADINGTATHRMMKLYRHPTDGNKVMGEMYRDPAAQLPRLVTLAEGGTAPNFEVLDVKELGEFTRNTLPMAPHSATGIEGAHVGVATLKKVLTAHSGGNQYALPAPRKLRSDPTKVDEFFQECLAAVADIWIPATVTEEPPNFAERMWFPPGAKLQDPNLVANAITGTAALGPALPVDNPHIGGAKRIRESHVDTDEISDNHGGIPAIFECDESHYVQGGELAVWLAQIVDVREDNNNPGCSIYRAIWYEDPVLAANGDTGTAEVYSRDGPGTYIGLPQYRLITADSSLNHGTNQKNGKWKKGGASCGMRLPKSAMAFWKTVVEETIARKDADRAAEPSDIDSEPVSRAKAAKRRRKATAA